MCQLLSTVLSIPVQSWFLVQKDEYIGCSFSLYSVLHSLDWYRKLTLLWLPRFVTASQLFVWLQASSCLQLVDVKISSRIHAFWRTEFCSSHSCIQKRNSNPLLFFGINVPYSLRLRENCCLWEPLIWTIIQNQIIINGNLRNFD